MTFVNPRFTAWSMCPACERIDVHSLRAPATFDQNNPLDVAREQITMIGWISGLGLDKMTPSQEAQFEVIRTCQCGKEWGEL